MAHSQNRRDFLKSCGIAGFSLIPGTLGALGNQTFRGSDTFVRSICEMCSSRCLMEARVIDGKTVFIQGNAHSKEIETSLCARGVAGSSQLYDPQRLVKPLIRTGKRGENKWKEVSFKEALSFIAQNMNAPKAKYGAQSILFSSKSGESFEHLRFFAAAFGSPNSFSHWSSCPIAIETAFEHTMGIKLHRDFENARYILNFGHNLFEGIDVALTKQLATFCADGTKKLVVLDPRFSVVAAKADEWHPLKAGSDLAFVLALLHVWIRDGKYAKDFVQKYTIGFDKLIASVMDTTPKWQEDFTGISAKVVERIADEIYEASPRCIIDWGHKATTTKAEYQRTRAIVIANVLMGNIEKEGGIYFPKEADFINRLLGEKIVPPLHNPLSPPRLTIPRIDGARESGKHRFISSKHGVLQAIPEAILSQKPYPIKGWFMSRHNPLITLANPQKTKEAMEQLDFIVVNDIYLSESAMMADVILPEATYLERDEGISAMSSKSPAYAMRNKIVEPISKTRSHIEIFRELASLMGLSAHYLWQTTDELRLLQANGDVSLLKELLQKGYASPDVPPLLTLEADYVKRFVEKYPTCKGKLDKEGLLSHLFTHLKTPSGKIEIFCEKVEKEFVGYGVPRLVDMDVSQGYPYVLTSGKCAIHTNGHTANVPYLNMLVSDNPIWMHPSTAKAHGLKNGDAFYLQNKISKEKATVFITEGIRPDTLFAYMGFGRQTPHLKRAYGKGINPSKLLSLEESPICGAMITNVGVDIIKATL